MPPSFQDVNFNMSKTVVIFGGSGFIGTFLARHWLDSGRADQIVIADILPSTLEGMPGITYRKIDVRQPIPTDLSPQAPYWIFNFAAVHREPGHEAIEYFDTNIKGAENVCAYANKVNCKNIYFTSSISVYGPTNGPTPESAPFCPITPYGGSKFPAELIHTAWKNASSDRRLIIVRPGVVYGPKDPGNIGRMIAAIRRGYFAFPGSTKIIKSYAYIYGLMDSIDFCIDHTDSLIVYNYVENPTESLGDIVRHTKEFCNSKAPVLSIPTWLLLPAAQLVQFFMGARNPIHPVRVRKAGLPTNIVPNWLIENGFKFKYSFKSSLAHWKSVAPQDFN
jgi:nucleoside-diphosphate-sugar epimerase